MVLNKKLLLLSLSATFILNLTGFKATDDIQNPALQPDSAEAVEQTDTGQESITKNSSSTNELSTQATTQLARSQIVAKDNSTVAKEAIEEAPQYKPVRSPYVQEYALGDTLVTDKGAVYPDRIYETQALPNDPAADQWWVQSATLPALWETTTGSSDTILAIIDTGFALEHEEFTGRWHQNSAESGITLLEAPSQYNCSDRSLDLNENCNLIDDNFDGLVDNESGATTQENPSQLNCSDQSLTLNKSCNMIDDDNNGLVDDVRGWDFMNFDSSVQAGDINPYGQGTKHGSYVTGAAAATGNNGVGIAGVNWQTKILPIQALSDDGSGTSISVARGIRYAVAQGADVISMSLGGSYPDSYTRQAIKEAIAAGVIVVAASGNDGCDCISYPANYPEVVAVGALNQSNDRASFSSYGENLDILAPGTNLYTASWSANNPTSHYASGIAGTSLATPIVSGLLTSLIGDYPDLSPRQIIALLGENTDRLSLAENQSWLPTIGHGTVDGYKAITRPLQSHTPEIRYDFASVSNGNALYSNTSFEPDTTIRLHTCSEEQHGSTKIYRLVKSSDEFYSASETEVYHAENAGYTAEFFTYGCISLPIDAPESIRILQTHAEFSSRKKV